MERLLVTEEELIGILNKELHKLESPEYYNFVGGIMRLKDPDKHGCNWSEAVIRASGTSVKPVLPLADRIIQDAKKKYNLR